MEPDASVVVTAPAGVEVARLDAVVRKKAGWIAERVQSKRALPTAWVREFVSGETYLYLGRQYRSRVLRASLEEGNEAALRAAWLEVSVGRERDDAERASEVKAALVRWYRSHAAERLPERVEVWARAFGLPPPRVLLRDQAKRWASCDARGVLRVSWRIIQAPMRLLDYVVAHELVHLQHDDHGRGLWRVLGRAMPDYQQRRSTFSSSGQR